MTLVLSVDSRIDTFIDEGDPLPVDKPAGAVKREYVPINKTQKIFFHKEV